MVSAEYGLGLGSRVGFQTWGGDERQESSGLSGLAGLLRSAVFLLDNSIINPGFSSTLLDLVFIQDVADGRKGMSIPFLWYQLLRKLRSAPPISLLYLTFCIV